MKLWGQSEGHQASKHQKDASSPSQTGLVTLTPAGASFTLWESSGKTVVPLLLLFYSSRIEKSLWTDRTLPPPTPTWSHVSLQVMS